MNAALIWAPHPLYDGPGSHNRRPRIAYTVAHIRELAPLADGQAFVLRSSPGTVCFTSRGPAAARVYSFS